MIHLRLAILHKISLIMKLAFLGILFAACISWGTYVELAGTIYSPKFSQADFKSIQIGDSWESVMLKIGPPLEVGQFNKDGDVIEKSIKIEEVSWEYGVSASYSKQAHATADWNGYFLTFDKSRKVCKKDEIFIAD